MLGCRTTKFILNVAETFGFPVQIYWNESLKEVQLCVTSFWSHLLRYSLVGWISGAIFTLFIANGGVEALFSFYLERGFSLLDMSTTWIMWYCTCLQLAFLWKFYHKHFCHFNKIILEISATEISNSMKESHLPQSWIRFFWLQAIVIFICSVVGTIPIYMLCEIEPRSNATFQWTFTLLYFLALLSSIYSIHQAASNLLFFKVLFGALRGVQAFNTWITRPQQFIHPSDLLHKSQSIVQLFSSIEGRLGAVIFVEVLTNMLFAIFGVFQATNIYVALTEVTFGELQLSKLLHGFNSVLIGLLSCSRYLPFFRLGHNILRETKTAKYNIEEAIAKRHQQFSPNQLWQLEQVRENFGRSAAIQPMGLFDLNLSSACTTDGLLITYVVILIQFKLG